MTTNAKSSPRAVARMAGACQLLEALTTTFGLVLIPNRLVVAGDAAATAANILGHQPLFWLGFALSIAGLCFTSRGYFFFMSCSKL